MLQTLLIFVLFLGPLVFFHELGHYLFARLFGVRVEVFSIGFGPKLFRKKIGDTEYAVSLVPLGGYVKMFGDNPLERDSISKEEQKVAFTHKSKFAKFWIVFGGPLANFILAFVIYFALVIGGETVPESRLGIIPEDSYYHTIGLRTGDVLNKINETEILGFDDLNLIDSQIQTIEVQRGEDTKVLNVNVTSNEFLQKLAEVQPGIKAPIFMNNKGEAFYLFPNQDRKISSSWEQIKEDMTGVNDYYLYEIKSLEVNGLKELSFKDSPIVLSGVTKENYQSKLAERDLYPSELVVNNVRSGPAAKAGVQKNDIILAIEGKQLRNFNDLVNYTQLAKTKPKLDYKILSGNEVKNLTIAPEVQDGSAKIGIESASIPFNLGLVESKSLGLLASIQKAAYRTQEAMYKTMLGFKKLIFGEVSMKNLGGPFAIASLAKDSFDLSFSMFFRLMALISINLGLINLFPIPVLDGGHIVILGIETIYGGPLPEKILMRTQQVGLSLLFALMFVAIFNDVSRFF